MDSVFEAIFEVILGTVGKLARWVFFLGRKSLKELEKNDHYNPLIGVAIMTVVVLGLIVFKFSGDLFS